jgi:hypothetical protein
MRISTPFHLSSRSCIPLPRVIRSRRPIPLLTPWLRVSERTLGCTFGHPKSRSTKKIFTRKWETRSSVQHAGRRSRTSRRCTPVTVTKGRYIRMSFAGASVHRWTDTRTTIGVRRNSWRGTGHTVTDVYIHTFPYIHTHTHTHIIYAYSHGSVWAHTKFNFDFQLSDNYHLQFFWYNELCWSFPRLDWLHQDECCSTSSASSWCKSTHSSIYIHRNSPVRVRIRIHIRDRNSLFTSFGRIHTVSLISFGVAK